MKFQLFTQVALKKDLPQFGVKKGSIAIVVEVYEMSNGEENGYSLEGLIPNDTIEVSESQIEAVTTPIGTFTH
ncbi:DUF4926 domain-containing protein [Leptolyngbya sp. FACHB-17]|uniref:DUF4926 domain-containing protein n=1 Tax=unclassified Leptolyngbya TaxID=2650499 RepID=UPI001680D9FC|nr:DUF4926 domain-containing protein [Leptolyngbya sp. FACHB-17]MBD2082082.1 DUF4926 domain-containing protein [Leptolyngbya sp. FACHB-17]